MLLLMHNALRLWFIILHNLSCILLPYYSIISWHCRKWGLIFKTTFHQPNYLSTILHSTQSTERSHQLPLNINDPGYGQPWYLFLAECRERLSFVIYALRGALHYSTSLQSLSNLRTARTSARLFKLQIRNFGAATRKLQFNLRERVKSFPSLTAHWAALISVPLALSQTLQLTPVSYTHLTLPTNREV